MGWLKLELKKRLEQAKGLWTKELHTVLWTYHATPYSSNRVTPCRLVYGLDAMFPIELTDSNPRTMTMIEESNELAQKVQLDLVEKDKERAKIKDEAIKQQMARKNNTKVNPQEFKEGDLVLRKMELQRKPQGKGNQRRIGKDVFKLSERQEKEPTK